MSQDSLYLSIHTFFVNRIWFLSWLEYQPQLAWNRHKTISHFSKSFITIIAIREPQVKPARDKRYQNAQLVHRQRPSRTREVTYYPYESAWTITTWGIMRWAHFDWTVLRPQECNGSSNLSASVLGDTLPHVQSTIPLAPHTSASNRESLWTPKQITYASRCSKLELWLSHLRVSVCRQRVSHPVASPLPVPLGREGAVLNSPRWLR